MSFAAKKTASNRNHVIFLGAGASDSSGYPIGNKLRLRISCQKHLSAALHQDGKIDAETISACVNHASNSEAVEVFRHGGFGTVDEFSKLASENYPQHVQDMKKLMRLAFAVHNPEDKFQESDYYPFIQRLFRDDDLSNLKSHITVISFNYDCYLEYLLLTAYQHRQKLSGNDEEISDFYKNKLTSGFYNLNDLEWAEQNANFNYFKLHGSIAFARDSKFGYESLFLRSAKERLQMFRRDNKPENLPTPPIVFPWELFGAGGFIDESEFIFTRTASAAREKEVASMLYQAYKKTWTSAREQISRAEKISFVGLSMHPYLDEGFGFLFQNPPKAASIVVANPINEHYRNEKSRLHAASLCNKVVSLLGKVAPNMKLMRSQSEDDGGFDMESFGKTYEPDVTPRYSFKEFIEREMD